MDSDGVGTLATKSEAARMTGGRRTSKEIIGSERTREYESRQDESGTAGGVVVARVPTIGAS